MDLSTAVVERRSIRHFKSDSVPEEVIREIIEKARWAPSWSNTQPWELYVVMGDILERFRKTNRQKYLEEDSHPSEIPMPTDWPDPLKKRRTRLGRSVLESLSITSSMIPN
ncbi:MAG: nitroreductase family protein [Thermodesulfobacteriota bacterium]